jgi:hypothetical protein
MKICWEMFAFCKELGTEKKNMREIILHYFY